MCFDEGNTYKVGLKLDLAEKNTGLIRIPFRAAVLTMGNFSHEVKLFLFGGFFDGRPA